MNKSLTANGGWEDSWTSLYETMAKDYQYADPMSMMVFADNHDMSRIYTQVEEDYSRFVMAMAYILTTRGIPQIYYGTEVLMSNPGTDNHGVIRSDFPGGWSGDPVNAFTGEGMSSSQREAQTFLRKLLNWRKTAEAIHNGKMIHYTPENNVYVFFRYNDRQTVMVVLNRNDKPVSLDLERFRSMLGKSASGTDVITDEQIPLLKEIGPLLPGAMIIEVTR